MGYLASVLRDNGYKVQIYDAWLNGWTPEELAAKILEAPTPLFVGMSTYQSNMAQALKTLQIVKRSGDIKFVAASKAYNGNKWTPDMPINFVKNKKVHPVELKEILIPMLKRHLGCR